MEKYFPQTRQSAHGQTCMSYAWPDSSLSKGRGARLIKQDGHVNNLKLFNGNYSEVFVSSRAYVPKGYRFPMAAA